VTPRLHRKFVSVAREMSPELGAFIDAAGVIMIVPRRELSFPELLCRAVAGQQLSTKAAASIWARVVASRGRKKLLNHFLRCEPEALRACGLSGAKAKAMRCIAEASRAGLLSETELAALTHDERIQRLTAIWGVGRWTADMMGIFYFGDEDIWPEGDVTVRKTFQRMIGSSDATVEVAERFAPHRSYLALYLWKYADAPPA